VTLSPHLRGHLLLFDQRPAAGYDERSGPRLLLVFGLLEAVRLALLKGLYPPVPLWLLTAFQLGLALLSVRFVAGLRFSQIGLRPWREWSLTERSYFVQLLVIANVVFPIVFAGRLRTIASQPSVMSIVASAFVPYLFYGFYQEVVYRGILQSELVRRWGALAGILVSNLLFTFGPLHWHYLSLPASRAIPLYAATFAMGLFFGLLFRRSGNLWIGAVSHGIGNAYIVGSIGRPR
jgi:CAAX protease family protein